MSETKATVTFGPKEAWQKDDCFGMAMCLNRSTIAAKYGTATIRCCEREDCKERAAEIAREIGIFHITPPPPSAIMPYPHYHQCSINHWAEKSATPPVSATCPVIVTFRSACREMTVPCGLTLGPNGCPEHVVDALGYVAPGFYCRPDGGDPAASPVVPWKPLYDAIADADTQAIVLVQEYERQLANVRDDKEAFKSLYLTAQRVTDEMRAQLAAKERECAATNQLWTVTREERDAAKRRIAEAAKHLHGLVSVDGRPVSWGDVQTAIAILTATTPPGATVPPAFGRHRWRCGQDFGQGFPTHALAATHHGVAHRDITCHGHPLTFNESADPEETRAMVGGEVYPVAATGPNAPPVTVEALMALQRVTYVSTACVCDQHGECRKVRKFAPTLACACPCHEGVATERERADGTRYRWRCGSITSGRDFTNRDVAAKDHKYAHCDNAAAIVAGLIPAPTPQPAAPQGGRWQWKCQAVPGFMGGSGHATASDAADDHDETHLNCHAATITETAKDAR